MVVKPWSDRRLSPRYGFQDRGIEFIHYHGAVYLMLDMGMGKTRICIDSGRTLPYPMFIVAPKFAALDTWPDEFDKWNSTADYAVLHGPNKEEIWANTDKFTNIIITYDGLKWFNQVVEKKLRPLQKYFFVFDEASMVKNHESLRWLILNKMQPIMSEHRVALSGTPVPHSLADLWAQYHLLDQGAALCPDYYQFRSRFFDYTGPNGDPPYQTRLKRGMDKKIHSLVARTTMRLAAEDYLILPDLIFNPINIALPAKLQRMYNSLEDEFMLEFPNSTAIANSSAVLDHKLRQFLQGAVYATPPPNPNRPTDRRRPVAEHIHTIKAQVVKQLLEVAAGRPMLVAVQFKYEIGILEKVLGRKLPAITGATSGPLGRTHIKNWNAGKLPILVVHPKSVAYSLNLQHGGSDLVWMCLPWELDLWLQLIKRLHRQGQKRTVVVTVIAFKKTVDDKVASYLRRKELTQEGLFDAVARR